MMRILFLSLFFSPVWWAACQNSDSKNQEAASAPVSNQPFALPSTGMHSVEDATPDAQFSVLVNGLPDGTAKLIATLGDQRYIIDTALIRNGRFEFKQPQPYPAGFYYVLLPNNLNLQLILDANQRFSITADAGNILASIEVKGSLENELLYKNLKFQGPIDNQLKALQEQRKMRGAGSPDGDQVQKQIDSLVTARKEHLLTFGKEHPKAFFTKFKYAGQNPELPQPTLADGSINVPLQTFLYREALWDNVDFTDIRLLRTPVIENKLIRYIKDLTAQQADSLIFSTDRLLARVGLGNEYFKFFANYIPITYKPGSSTVMDAEAIQVHMVRNYHNREKAFWAKPDDLVKLEKQASEMENSLIGKKGPDVQAKDVNGVMRSIYEIKAPYIVVFLWNPECSHCKEETPVLKELYKTWKDKGMEVYGIAVNTTDEAYRKTAKDYGMPWSNVFDPTNRAIYAKYYVDNTPEIYVLNPDRIIIGKNLKANQIETIITRDMEKRGKSVGQ